MAFIRPAKAVTAVKAVSVARTPAALLLVLFIASTTSGCIYSREIQSTRREIQRMNPGLELDRNISANVGPVTLRFARWVTSAVDDEDARMASRYLRDIKRVKVGHYKVDDHNARGIDGIKGLDQLRRFRRPGWDLAAHVREDGEDVWVYYRERGERVTDIYAIVYSDDELIIAKVSGRLTRLLEEAMRDHARFNELGDWDLGFNQ